MWELGTTASWLRVLPTVTAASLLALWIVERWRRRALRPPPGASLEKQAIELEHEKGVYKSGLLAGKGDFIESAYPEVTNLLEAFLRGLEISRNGPCVGVRPGGTGDYAWLTYTDVYQQARDIGALLVGPFAQKPGAQTHVGIYARNSPEWFMTALGCVTQSLVVVPLYDTLGAEASEYIVEQTEIEVIFVDSVAKAERLLAGKKRLPTLKHVVVIEAATLTPDFLKRAKEAGLNVLTFKEAADLGLKNPTKMQPPQADDNYLICYTSGTTGLPKGVILTHRNLICNMSAFHGMLVQFLPDVVGPQNSHISYLPLSHMIEQMTHWCSVVMGAKIGYFSGNIPKLTEDMRALKPTFFPVVPRLLNRFYDLIQANLAKASPIGRAVFKLAYQQKLALLKQGVVSRDTIWDRLVFRKVQAQLGGRVEFIATGSAPISEEVLEMCRVVLGAVIVEAYGQTEVTAIATFTWPGDVVGGHCGGPAGCTLLKLGDVPELNYYAKDGKGEIMIKGPSITKGYFKEPEKTAELFDKDGFVHTGDIAQLLPNGTIRIIDRKKHIFKLAQGEYVAPEKIENVYTRAGCVQQIFVDGDSLQKYLVAVVVPEPDELKKWAASEGLNADDLDELYKLDKTHDYVLNEIRALGKENKLNSIEQVKRVHLTSEVFSVENGLLTPTLKAKRPQLREKYKTVFADIYRRYPDL